MLGHSTCCACGKDRGLHGSDKCVPSEFIDWMQNAHMPDHDYQCGDALCPNNNPRYVKFPAWNWHNENFLVEVRHKTHCSIPAEVQVSLVDILSIPHLTMH